MLAPAQASGLALRPCVKGYCRPDLPAHYREKIGFVLGRIVSVGGEKGGDLDESEGLQGVAG